MSTNRSKSHRKVIPGIIDFIQAAKADPMDIIYHGNQFYYVDDISLEFSSDKISEKYPYDVKEDDIDPKHSLVTLVLVRIDLSKSIKQLCFYENNEVFKEVKFRGTDLLLIVEIPGLNTDRNFKEIIDENLINHKS